MSFLKSVVFKSASRLFITNFKIQTQRFVLCLLISALCILYLPCAAVAGTATVTVGWNPSTGSVAGYELCYGRFSHNYDYVVDVGQNTSCSISGLEVGTTYYFAVKAYNSAGEKSTFSEEMKYTVSLTTMSMATNALDNPDSGFIDNSDSGFETIGYWKSSAYSSGFYGNNYQYAPKGNGALSASWTYNINTKGQYDIYAQWASHSNRAPDAPYRIYNNGRLLDVVLVDQRKSGGQFNLLGMYFLNSGTLEIVLTNDASGYVIADATLIAFSEPAIDNSDHDFTTIGTWKSSTSASGFYGSDYQYAPKGNGALSASWIYNINTQGQYEIYAQWTSHSNRAPDAPYNIYYNGKLLDVVLVDQRKSGGQFNLLGTYSLNSGTLEIVLTNDASGYVIADATQIDFLK